MVVTPQRSSGDPGRDKVLTRPAPQAGESGEVHVPSRASESLAAPAIEPLPAAAPPARSELALEIEIVKRQIGRDLHDGLGQLLAGAAMFAQNLELSVGADHQPEVHRLVELLGQAGDEVRCFCRDLTTPPREPRDLVSALRQVVSESAERMSVRCALEVREAGTAQRPDAVANLCFIVREAITNAVRHGRSRNVVVTLERRDARWLLAIADDGARPRAGRAREEGLGLRSMRHRAALIGGVLETEVAETGTIVRCWWIA